MTDGVATSRWNRLSNWPRHHPLLADALLVITVLLFFALVSRTVIFEAPLVLPLIWRRRYPMIVFACISAIAMVQWVIGGVMLADIALLIAVYTVAAHRERRWALIAWGVLEVGVLLAVLKWAPNWPMSFIFLSGLATAAFVLGRNVRTRRAYLATLEDRARRAEHERDQQAQLAAAAERARIAREMHDIVTHNLSVMITLADGAAFTARGNPVAAEGAARQVSATGRQALAEMHRLLGVLRGNGSEPMRAPQPGIDQLDALVAQVRSAGLRTSLTLTGTPFPVPATAQLAVYRVVQEALTNVLKHAGSAKSARVTVRYNEPVLEVEIDDDGPGGQPVSSVRGHGLDGMAERVSIFDGEVLAGPRPDGGWRVRATLTSGLVAR